MKIGLYTYPPIYHSSLWRVTTDIAAALKELGHQVIIAYHPDRAESYFKIRQPLEKDIYLYPVKDENVPEVLNQCDYNIVYNPMSRVNISGIEWEKIRYSVYALYEGIILNPMNNKVIGYADKVIATTPAHMKLLEKTFNKEVKYIPHTFNSDIFRWSDYTYGDREGLLFIGNYYPRKNIPYLFALASQLPDEIRITLIVSLGYSDFKAKLRLLNRIWKTEDKIEVWNMNFLPNDLDIAFQYSIHKYYISLSGAEGFELPLLESMACGTPVIKLWTPEAQWNDWEWIEPESIQYTWWGGYFIPKINEETVNFITDLYYDEKIWKRIRDKYKKRINDFTWDKWVSRWEEVINEV